MNNNKRFKSKKKENQNKITDEHICQALTKTNGALGAAARLLGKDPSWMTHRRDQSDIVRKHCEQLVEERIDKAEQALDRLMEKDNSTIVIFTLKTIGHKRGWIERAPMEDVDQTKIKIMNDFFARVDKLKKSQLPPKSDAPEDLGL